MEETSQADVDVGRSPKAMLFALVATFVALCVAVCLLPHDRYIRYQQLSQTMQFRQQWAYERVHFDPTPIDVALVGVSRTLAGISGPGLEDRLSQSLGRPVHVANLSMPQQGRNAHFIVARELLQNRPETRVLILAVVEQMPRVAHPVFRNIAELEDVVTAPKVINYSYIDDLTFMPWRQLSLFVQSSFPQAFGVTTRFDAANYLGTDVDAVNSFGAPQDEVIDRDHIGDEPEMRSSSVQYLRNLAPPRFPAAMVEYEFVGERTYMREIAELARANGTQIVFVFLPIYTGPQAPPPGDFIEGFGPILSAGMLANQPELYSDFGHVNRNGAAVLTDWLAQELTSRLDPQTLRLTDQEGAANVQ
jgi:hypothetical protein